MKLKFRSLRGFYSWRNRPECPNHRWFAKDKDFEVIDGRYGGKWYRCLLCLMAVPRIKEKNKLYEVWAKETLADEYIIKMIKKNSTLLDHQIPASLIEVKRLSLQIKAAIKEKKGK